MFKQYSRIILKLKFPKFIFQQFTNIADETWNGRWFKIIVQSEITETTTNFWCYSLFNELACVWVDINQYWEQKTRQSVIHQSYIEKKPQSCLLNVIASGKLTPFACNRDMFTNENYKNKLSERESFAAANEIDDEMTNVSMDLILHKLGMNHS